MNSLDILGKEFISIKHALKKTVAKIVPPKDVEDIVQDVYVRACQTENKINQPRSFMMKIAKNLAIDYLKSARVRLSVNFEDEQEHIESAINISEDTTLRDVESKKQFAEFCKVTSTLPPQARKAFILKKVYGYSQREIADDMQLSESTVEKHIALGLKQCKQALSAMKEESSPRKKSGGRK